jgi:hypothetical protein
MDSLIAINVYQEEINEIFFLNEGLPDIDTIEFLYAIGDITKNDLNDFRQLENLMEKISNKPENGATIFQAKKLAEKKAIMFSEHII